jgi:hypothetical protein
MSEWDLELLVRSRLEELRAVGEQAYRYPAVQPASRPLRVVLGHMLIRMGHGLLRVHGYPLLKSDPRARVKPRRTSAPGVMRG